MDLETVLLEEHSKAQCEKTVHYIGHNQKRFDELMNLFFHGGYRIAQRASWPMSYCVAAHPELIIPHFKKLFRLLENPDVHNAVQRNIVRLLQNVSIPKHHHGQVMNACFNFVASHTTPVAIKAFSLTILENLSKDYPEILPELKLIIQERWEHETAAFHSRARKILEGS